MSLASNLASDYGHLFLDGLKEEGSLSAEAVAGRIADLFIGTSSSDWSTALKPVVNSLYKEGPIAFDRANTPKFAFYDNLATGVGLNAIGPIEQDSGPILPLCIATQISQNQTKLVVASNDRFSPEPLVAPQHLAWVKVTCKEEMDRMNEILDVCSKIKPEVLKSILNHVFRVLSFGLESQYFYVYTKNSNDPQPSQIKGLGDLWHIMSSDYADLGGSRRKEGKDQHFFINEFVDKNIGAINPNIRNIFEALFTIFPAKFEKAIGLVDEWNDSIRHDVEVVEFQRKQEAGNVVAAVNTAMAELNKLILGLLSDPDQALTLDEVETMLQPVEDGLENPLAEIFRKFNEETGGLSGENTFRGLIESQFELLRAMQDKSENNSLEAFRMIIERLSNNESLEGLDPEVVAMAKELYETGEVDSIQRIQEALKGLMALDGLSLEYLGGLELNEKEREVLILVGSLAKEQRFTDALGGVNYYLRELGQQGLLEKLLERDRVAIINPSMTTRESFKAVLQIGIENWFANLRTQTLEKIKTGKLLFKLLGLDPETLIEIANDSGAFDSSVDDDTKLLSLISEKVKRFLETVNQCLEVSPDLDISSLVFNKAALLERTVSSVNVTTPKAKRTELAKEFKTGLIRSLLLGNEEEVLSETFKRVQEDQNFVPASGVNDTNFGELLSNLKVGQEIKGYMIEALTGNKELPENRIFQISYGGNVVLLRSSLEKPTDIAKHFIFLGVAKNQKVAGFIIKNWDLLSSNHELEGVSNDKGL